MSYKYIHNLIFCKFFWTIFLLKKPIFLYINPILGQKQFDILYNLILMIMNRGFFVVFFMYFFVVQSALFGFIRWEANFYVIWLINLVFIILMALFYVHFDTSKMHSHEANEGSHAMGVPFVLAIALLSLVVLDKSFFGLLSVSIWPFAALYFIMLLLSAKKLLAKKITLGKMVFAPKDFLFWTSLIIMVSVYGTLPLAVFSFKLFLSLLVWCIFFFIGARIVRGNGSFHVFTSLFTRSYLIALLLVGGVLLVQNSSSSYQYRIWSDWNMIKTLFVSSFGSSSEKENILDNPLNEQDILSNWSWQLLSSSLSSVPPDTSSWSQEIPLSNEDALSLSTDVLPSAQVWESQEDDRLKIASLPTMMDVLIYLMDHYEITLSSKKDITFTYVTPKNPYYAQFRTAYDMKLIWSTTNPSKHVLCETYMVMKGIMEERNLPSSGNIFSLSWKEAKDKGVLNWCKVGFYVKNINL